MIKRFNGCIEMKIAAATFLASALPLLLYVLRYPTAAPIVLFAGDAFYYPDIARNSRGMSGFSFDGIYQTNGFHPLWEYVLSLCYHTGLLHLTSSAHDLLVIYCVDLFLVAAGGSVFAVLASRFLRRPWLALGVVAPGYVWFLIAPAIPTLTSWSFLNGMESGLALALTGSASLLAWPTRASLSRDVIFSTILGLGVLARLDEIFLLVAFGISAVFLEHPSSKRLIARCLPAVALVLLYLVYNRHTVGVFLPTSGAIKAGLAFTQNVKYLLKQFLPVLSGDKPLMLDDGQMFFGFAALHVRIVQMVVPALICGIELFRRRRYNISPERTLMQTLCLGVLLKAAYNFAFVQSFNQGEWYYVVSFAITNVVLALWVDEALTKVNGAVLQEVKGWVSWTASIGYVLCVLFTFNIFVSYKNYYSTLNLFRIIRDGRLIRQTILTAGYDRFLEFDDGGLGFGIGLPSTAGFGLALDPEATNACRTHSFFALMSRRRISLVIAADSYAAELDHYLAASDWTKGLNFNEISALEFHDFQLRRIARDPEHGLTFYRLEPVSR